MINTTKSITIELPKPLHEIIVDVVCGYFGTSRETLFATSRDQVLVDRRHILFYILHRETEMSDIELSQLLNIGRRIIQHGIDKVDAERHTYRNRYSYDIDAITTSVRNMFNPMRDWVALAAK